MSLESEIQHTFLDERLASFIAVGLAAVAIYDHVVTIGGEIQFVWARWKWTLAQLMFLINRYLSNAILILGAVSLIKNGGVKNKHVRVSPYFAHGSPFITLIPYRCQDLIAAVAWGTIVAFWALQVIVILRISSMYNHSRKIIALLVIAFACEAIAASILERFSGTHPSSNAVDASAETVSRCLPSPSPWWSNLFWISIITYESLMLGLAIRRGLQSPEDMCLFSEYAASGASGVSLSQVLIRDSLLCPLVILTVCIVTFVGSMHFSLAGKQISIAVAGFVTHILGSRLALNLREIYYRLVEEVDDEGDIVLDLPIAFAPTTEDEKPVI
ncbi:hypothetical protein GALMADRAFT_154275 [Galerina marginata CBS 339.88]|uniref:DUF6533 domain-containing protein n=1 Tax=Galerina marginata (strain CBS 339.88) TaxID=685588 RepID=A0A067THI0_GALM3|nr:hypothetical protein GALMADRAFT_154275 [Galerina marginata CBS 339.88]